MHQVASQLIQAMTNKFVVAIDGSASAHKAFLVALRLRKSEDLIQVRTQQV